MRHGQWEEGTQQSTGNYKAAMLKLLKAGLIVPTIPDKPNSCLQQYRLTELGKDLPQGANKAL